jgi:hypothetical protein
VRRLMAVLVVGFLYLGLASPIQAQTASYQPLNKWRASATRVDETGGLDQVVSTLRAGNAAYFLFGEQAGVTSATAASSDVIFIERGANAVLCLNPDIETEALTAVPDSTNAVTVYLLLVGKETGPITSRTSIVLPGGLSVDGTTCVEPPGGAYIWLTYVAANAADRPVAVIFGRGY